MKTVGACGDQHKHSETVVRHWCKDRSCPICYPIWAGRVGVRGTERLMAYNDINNQMFGMSQRDIINGVRLGGVPGFEHPGPAKHFMFSPPQEWAIGKLNSLSGIRGLRRELYHVLDIAGIRAGVVVFHLWRATGKARDEFHQAKENGARASNHGLWHWLVRSGLFGNDEYTYLSPHFHVVGMGYALKSDEFHQVTAKRGRDGWIYKNIRPLNDKKSISNVLFYVLGHSAIIQDMKTGKSLDSITYYGDISVSRMARLRETVEYFPVECPKCSTSVHEWVGWDQEKKFDKEKNEDCWCWHWNDEDHQVKPKITFDIMTYRVEKHKYWLKGSKKYYSIQIRGDEPIHEPGPPTSEMIVDEHDTHAYDWVSGQWYDMNGDVVE